MIFDLKLRDDEKLQKFYDSALKELGEFYEINWIHNKPRVYILNNRATIEGLRGQSSEPWQIGWSEPSGIYLLDQDCMESESSHKRKSDEEYSIFMKHEISHSFSRVITKVGQKEIKPKWLWEGVAVYTSGELAKKKRPDTFTGFLKYYDNQDMHVYKESGFVIELLINKFGKQKFLELLKRLKESTNEQEFNELFKSVYNIELSYESINKLWL